MIVKGPSWAFFTIGALVIIALVLSRAIMLPLTKIATRPLHMFSILKYIIQSISYGLFAGVILILFFPSLGLSSFSLHSLFTTQNAQPAPLSYAKAVSKAGPAVVNIYSSALEPDPLDRRRSTNTTQLGSGVIMKSNGYILTNYHVVQSADLIEVWLQNGSKYPAELIGFDKYTDLAVLAVNALNLPVIPINDALTPVTGDVVLAIGNPLNLGQTITQGIISATGRNGLSNTITQTSYLEFLQMDAAINEGNSGGALVNTNGDLVGINSRRLTQAQAQLDIQGIFFAVPYKLAYNVMEKIITHGRVVRGWLGISVNGYNDNLKGVVIDAVTANGPAAKAGLKRGDVLVNINGISISSITQALDLIVETKPNSVIELIVYRKNQRITLPVTIGEFI